MSDSSPPALQPVFQQAFQGILARNVTNNYVSLPVHYHQPSGTRYIPMGVLRNMYPGIIRLQVDGQTIRPRRGLPTAQSMFQSVLSQWVDETSVGLDAEEERGSNTSYPENRGESASSSFVVVSQNDGGGTLVGGSNASLFSEPTSRTLSDDDANTIEYIEYQPDSIIQVVHYTPGPIETPTPTGGSQSGTGMTEGDFPPSFWARIRQEIYTAVRQVHQELADEQPQAHGGNSNYGNQAAATAGVVSVSSLSPTSSWIETRCSTNQTHPPSKGSAISLSSLSSPKAGSQRSGSEPDGMDEDVVVVTRSAGSKVRCKNKKRDRDEEYVDDSLSTTSGSEKRLRSNATSPESASPSTDEGDDDDEDKDSGSQKSSPSKASSRSGSGSRGSGAGSDSETGSSSGSSYYPGSGSSSSSGSGSSSGSSAVSSGSSSEAGLLEPVLSRGSGSRSGTSPFSSSRANFGSGSGLSSSVASHGTEPGSPTGSGLGSSSSSLQEPYATSESQAVTPEPGASSVSFEILAPPLLGGKHAPAMLRQSDELNRRDTMMITTDTEGNQLEDEIISIDSGDGDDIDPDNTQPLRITDNQLRDFVAKRKGLLVRDSQAVTICLKTSKDARRFYRFLKSPDYFGTWLNIKLTWTWDREQLGQLVEALIDSPIKVLFFDGCIDRAAIAATTATTALDTSVNALATASTSKEGDNQSVDSNTNNRRYDPLVRLFRHHRFKELHFYGLPKLFHHSIAPIPWDLSHLSSFRLHARISDWEGIQANRLLQFIKRAINLEHLYIGCPSERYMKYVNEITRAMDLSERNRNSPPLDIHFQHHQHRHTLLRVKYGQLDREFKEFEVDLMGTSYESHIQWKPILDQLVDGTLVSLSFNNMLDETWMDTVMEWVYIQANDRGFGLENLQLDCMHFGPTQYQNLIELLELTQPRLQTLNLRNVYISFPNNTPSPSGTSATPTTMPDRDLDLDIDRSDAIASVPMIDWPTFVKSLNIAVLLVLCIRTSNLQDRDIDGVASCLRTMVRNSKKLALEKLLLQGAQLSLNGEQTLVKEIQAILPGVDVKFR